MSRVPFSSNTTKQKVFLIGGCGFVGIAFAKRLHAEGYLVFIVDVIDPPSDVSNYATFLPESIMNLSGLKDAVQSEMPVAAVIHLASVGMSGVDMLLPSTQKTNIYGTQNIVNVCYSCNVGTLIYISTPNVVFGGQTIENGNEKMQYYPVDAHTDKYSASKSVAEQIILAANTRKLVTCAIRPAAIYGEGEQRHLPRILRHIDSGLFLARIGSAIVDWLHVENFCDAIVLVTKKLCKNGRGDDFHQSAPAGHAYFVSDGEPIGNFEFLRPLVAARQCRYPSLVVPGWLLLPFTILSEKISYTLRFYFDITCHPFLTRAEIAKVGVTHFFSINKFKTEFRYSPRISSTEGAKRLAKYYSIDGPGGKNFSMHFFRFVHPLAMTLIVFGMSVLYYFAFYEYDPSQNLRLVLDPLHQIAYGIFISKDNLKLVFHLAVLCHFLEAFYAVYLCYRIGCEKKISWFYQTILFGYGSLVHLNSRVAAVHVKES